MEGFFFRNTAVIVLVQCIIISHKCILTTSQMRHVDARSKMEEKENTRNSNNFFCQIIPKDKQ